MVTTPVVERLDFIDQPQVFGNRAASLPILNTLGRQLLELRGVFLLRYLEDRLPLVFVILSAYRWKTKFPGLSDHRQIRLAQERIYRNISSMLEGQTLPTV